MFFVKIVFISMVLVCIKVFSGWRNIDTVLRKEMFEDDEDEKIDIFDVKVELPFDIIYFMKILPKHVFKFVLVFHFNFCSVKSGEWG